MVGLTQVKFLVIDDNVHMLNIVETILRGFGARKIVRAGEAGEAMDHIRNSGIDILITDSRIERLDVVDFARGIRRVEGTHDRFIPILLLTAHSARPRIEAARDAGVTEICCKPVTPRELFRRIVAIVDYPRPFVLAPDYVGPERRRKVDPAYAGPERRDGWIAATSAA